MKQGYEMSIHYAFEPDLPVREFQDILLASTLAERRPVNDPARLEQMLRQADLVLTAREEGRLVGIARAVTDFSYCCYLSDLAVAADRQRQGIGKTLIARMRAELGDGVTLILVAAPAAQAYYPKIGMTHLPGCWAFARAR
jgi:ribosomal protein S18 acetylase RimI-like enzyme